MKKIILLALLLVGMTANAFAVTTFTTDTGSSLGSTTFKTSTLVTLKASGDTAGYNVASKHLQGDKIFQSSSNEANIVEADGVKGTALADGDVPSTYDIP